MGGPSSSSMANHKCQKRLIVKLDEGLPDLNICIEDSSLTCGWLLNEVTKLYSGVFEQYKQDWQQKEAQ